jgi:hypothetical protein
MKPRKNTYGLGTYGLGIYGIGEVQDKGKGRK